MSNGNRFPYFELILDNPVNVIGDFYIITDFAKPSKYNKDGVLYEDTLNNKYNWAINPIVQTTVGIDIPLIVNQKPCIKQAVMMHQVKYYGGPNKPDIEDFGWLDVYDTASYGNLNLYFNMYEYLSTVHGLYLFPLIGEDEEDTVSSVASVEVENYTYVFPNPASENITIQSSFKIQTIEMFNEQGQKVFVTQPNSYNSTINVSSYQKGTYIIKTATKSGSATKKIVVQ